MSWSTNDIGELTGKVMLVTGANSGIGFEAASVLAKHGAHVLMACRDLAKAEAKAAQIRSEHASAHVEPLALDLSSLASVRAMAAVVRARFPQLHALINNAGVMAVPHALTQDGFEMQLGVNHFGHFALTGLLLDRLLATPGARVVNVSSMAHRIGKMYWDDLDGTQHYDKWPFYGQSKLANLLFTFELARRLDTKGAKSAELASVACHPGYANTNLQFVGPELEGSRISGMIMKVGNTLFAQSAQAGAWPTLYAATSPNAHSGDFIGPSLTWFGKPAHAQARKLAHNAEVMSKLWHVSVARTGVDFAALG